MGFCKVLAIITFIIPGVLVSAIIPSNRNFIYNKKSPSSDLRPISGSQASYISRFWLDAIIKNKPSIAIEDKHVVGQINRLENHIQNNFNDKDMYLAWMPQGDTIEVLFLIVLKVDIYKQQMIVQHMVQSPNWSYDQIKSSKLRNSLKDTASKSGTILCLTQLYKAEPRYHIDWEYWDNTQ